MAFYAKTVSSLVKQLPKSEFAGGQISRASALYGEKFSFQALYMSEAQVNLGVHVKCVSPLSGSIKLYSVRCVPSMLPVHALNDDYYISDKPGMYPDVLEPVAGPLTALKNIWQSVWVEVDVNDGYTPGDYDIDIVFSDNDGCEIGRTSLVLEIIGVNLPKQDTIVTQWFHADCIADVHRVEVLSENWWALVREYMLMASSHGQNMILTPVFTPPLDTQVGGERTTVQLVDVWFNNNTYYFDFANLRRWIELALECGFEYFEISHLFTQWGAKHAPKVMAHVGGEYKRIFGWETDSCGEEYTGFIREFVPKVIGVMEEFGLREKTVFHVSDEPHLEHMEEYSKCAALMKDLCGDIKIIDALSNIDFYNSGAVRHPVPSSNRIEPFLEANIPWLWTYYCVSQHTEYTSNRFMGMPSLRNRILGVQLFKHNIAGFLQWGYNFYNTQYSIKHIDPYSVTDAGQAFPSGDAFIVYPGQDGCLPSLRLKVFREAFQDVRALKLASSLIGRAGVLAVLEKDIDPITFKQYPHDEYWLMDMRERINNCIKENMK